MPSGDPPKKFCDSQVRKVIRTVLTFDPRDSLEWRECAEALIDEACARRYLVGLDWMASRAVMAISKTIRWRLDIGLHRSSIGRGACGRMQDHDFLPMDEDTPIRVSPVKDAEGRPVVIFSAIRWPKDDTEWLRMLIGALEVAAVRLRAERTTPGGGRRPHEGEGRSKSGGDTWLWLVDMEGAGPGNAPSWQTLRNLDGILAAHYPGRLRNVLIVNSSAFLRISMSFMEKLLDEKARAKLVIVDGRTVKLERYISSADPLATLSYRE